MAPTPCRSVCEMDARTGLCAGCGRTGDEIEAWGTLTADLQLRIMGELAERMRRAGLAPAPAPDAKTLDEE